MKTSKHEIFFRLQLCTSLCLLTISILSSSLVWGGERGEYLCIKHGGAISATYYDENLHYVVVDCKDNKEYYVEKVIASGQEIWFLRDITQTWSKYGTKESMEVILLSSSSLEDIGLIMLGLATGRFSLKQVGENLWRITGAKGKAAPYTFPKHLKK